MISETVAQSSLLNCSQSIAKHPAHVSEELAQFLALKKQSMLFALAARNRARGHKPCGWRALARAYLRQWRLVDLYPSSN